MKRILWLVPFVVAACMGARVNTSPVPELPPAEVWIRGTEAQAGQLTQADETEIVSNVVRGFYRPAGRQVRLVGVKPLADARSRWADSVIAADVNRAEALTRGIGLEKVCRESGTEPACAGNQSGGVLRFSPAYRVARDSAVIFAEYTPLLGGGGGEIEFRMVRTAGGWQMASRRSLMPVAPESELARAAAERLIETDRAYGIASGGTDLISAFSAMFDDSVIVQILGGFADGKPAAIAALRATPDNERSKATWTPVRAGVSADRQHGFSYGYMTLARSDGARVPLKYLAYWVNRGGEWRVLAYKRRPRPAGEVSMTALPPALPSAVGSVPGPGSAESLAAAEKEFSDTAQVIGIGPAFERYGRVDAMNMGGPSDTAFVFGARAIGRSVGAGYPAVGSPVHWAADHRRIVASSGDLGVTFGYIRPHAAPPAGQPPFFPFFTIWKRDPGGPWRYIAE